MCQSNLRQLALASQMYANDDNDRLPGIDDGALDMYWGERLKPYLALQTPGPLNPAPAHCPKVDPSQIAEPNPWLPPEMSYGINSYVDMSLWDRRRSVKTDAAKIIFMGDKSPSFDERLVSEDGGWYDPSNLNGTPGNHIIMLAHKGWRNRRHADGRAIWSCSMATWNRSRPMS